MKKVLMLDRLKNEGYKITPQRQEIIKCFGAGGQHYSADEIHQKVRRRFPNISLDTVYRNLNTLKALGIISILNFEEGKSRYELAVRSSHHHHLICLRCGDSEELRFCPLKFFDSTLLSEKNFTAERHSFEIFGYCSVCSKAQ